MRRTIVITGTASGFGHLSVRRFTEAGWNVVATVRKESDAGAHSELENVKTLVLDVNDEEACLAFGELAVTQFGRVDALIRSLNVVRSDPAITVEVMFRMVTDGNARKVHYYSGPDGEAIPRVKQLLGQDWYWEELSARNRGESTALWNTLMPRPKAPDGQ